MSSILIKYTVDGDTPLTVSQYILQAESNTTTLNAGETATLKFLADGLYFMLIPLKTKVVVENAVLESWTCKTPFLEGTLTISSVIDADADVIITIPTRVKIAPQPVTKPFLLKAATPLDTRLVLTKKEMLAVIDSHMPEVYFALCKDNGKFYIYHKDNKIISKDTGKFSLVDDTIYSVDGGEILPLEPDN